MGETEEKLLSVSQAADFLGVKAATLYAYTSRGLIESIPSDKPRQRCYRLSELIKLRQAARGFRSSPEADAAVWVGPSIKSAITELTSAGPRYRGQSAIDLALSDIPFENVAELLWSTEGGAQDWHHLKPLAIPKQLKSRLGGDADYLDLFKLLLVLLEMDDPVPRKLQSSDMLGAARRLIVTMAILPGIPAQRTEYLGDGQTPIAQTLLSSLSGKRQKEQARMVNRALVLCADHELNPSALAARVAGSCDASMYSCLLSALGSFSGSLHGSASKRTEELVLSSLKFSTAKSWLKDFLSHSESIPGFGTKLYEQGDPRAKLLIAWGRELAPKNVFLQRLTDVLHCVREQLGLEPNLDVGLAALSQALSLPAGSGTTIFAVSRTAGWIAHATEQRLYGGGVIRPRANYIGKS